MRLTWEEVQGGLVAGAVALAGKAAGVGGREDCRQPYQMPVKDSRIGDICHTPRKAIKLKRQDPFLSHSYRLPLFRAADWRVMMQQSPTRNKYWG